MNGIRIEPGEIEAALLALHGISAAIVTLREDEVGASRLTAYLVAKSCAQQASEEVRAALARQLPKHMVPSYFVWLDAMPLTPNGKLDRKALPAPQRAEKPPLTNRPPESNLEQEIAAIWEDLLNKSGIGVQSEFFDLGGDSLALLSLFATIELRFGRRLTVDVLSGGLTIAGLAQILAGDEAAPAKMDPVVALQPNGHLPPFFCVHGVAGDLYHLHRLSMHMGSDRPFFGIRRTPESRFTDTLNQMAERYVAAMMAHQPAGPYYLGGHSFGATVAYEMAVQLVKQGHEIGLLAIIDQRRPAWQLTARRAIPALPRILANLPGRIRDNLADVPAANRFSHLARTLARWSKPALGLRVEASNMFDFSHGDADLRMLFESNIRAIREYNPKPLHAPVLLIRSKQQLLSHLALDATLGWGDFVTTDVRIRVVPGNHRTMATEPLVQELAQTLRTELDAAQHVR